MHGRTITLRLSPAAEAAAQRLADSEGVSLDLWIANVVAQKILLEAGEFFPNIRRTPRLGGPKPNNK
jgi:hypothetical protein